MQLLRPLSAALFALVVCGSASAGTVIAVEDGNYENRGELYLVHKHDGVDLKLDYARDTLRNLQSLWRRPVNLVTRVEGRGMLFHFDGKEHSERRVDL